MSFQQGFRRHKLQWFYFSLTALNQSCFLFENRYQSVSSKPWLSTSWCWTLQAASSRFLRTVVSKSSSLSSGPRGHTLIACQLIIIFTMSFDKRYSWLGGWPLPCTLRRHTGFGSNRLWQKLDCQKYPSPPLSRRHGSAVVPVHSSSLWDSVCLSWSSVIISFAEWLGVISRLLRRMQDRILWHNGSY